MALASRYLIASTSTKPLLTRTVSTTPIRLQDILPSSPQNNHSNSPPTTHYKITLHRSAISLGSRIKSTLESLGIHRRFQTVYHRHTPEAAGKILKVKELVQVENVTTDMVKTKQEMTKDRKAKRGYTVTGERRSAI